MKTKAEVMKDLGRVRRRKITLQKLTTTVDSIGQQKESWADWLDLWVEREGLWGNEYYSAKAVNEENTVVFIAKYAPFVETLDVAKVRISFEGKYFDIKQIDHLKDDGRLIKIKALEKER